MPKPHTPFTVRSATNNRLVLARTRGPRAAVAVALESLTEDGPYSAIEVVDYRHGSHDLAEVVFIVTADKHGEVGAAVSRQCRDTMLSGDVFRDEVTRAEETITRDAASLTIGQATRMGERLALIAKTASLTSTRSAAEAARNTLLALVRRRA